MDPPPTLGYKTGVLFNPMDQKAPIPTKGNTGSGVVWLEGYSKCIGLLQIIVAKEAPCMLHCMQFDKPEAKYHSLD